ncbi:MAG: family 20 glycosylhydrolase [Armatimonadota bacterium]
MFCFGQNYSTKEIFKSLFPIPKKIELLDGVVEKKNNINENVNPVGDDRSEKYKLICSQDGIVIEADSKRGAFYAKKTLAQLDMMDDIPCCVIEDEPAMEIRAVMFDLARCKEKHEYYYYMIDLLSKWKINTVFLHLNDNDGCALEIKSYPILTSKYAFTQEEMKDLIKYAAERYIELIPEIECFGHSRYILQHEEFAHLNENPENPKTLCTSNPQTWEIVNNLMEETANLFPSEYIHAGCDEASYGKCDVCAAWAEKEGLDTVVYTHIKKTCDIVKSKGKKPIIWADVLLNHRDIADRLSKDIILSPWNYRDVVDPEPIKFLIEKGYKILGCPAVAMGSRMILPKEDAIPNIESWTDIIIKNNCWGMETTAWVPQRYIADTLYDTLAYASELSWSGRERTAFEFMKGFVEGFFGIKDSDELAEAFVEIHTLSELAYDKISDLWNYFAQIVEDKTELWMVDNKLRMYNAEKILSILKSYRDKVNIHNTEYSAYILACETAYHIQDRAFNVYSIVDALKRAEKIQETERPKVLKQLEIVVRLLEKLFQKETHIERKLIEAWDRWRYEDHPLKTGTGQNILGNMHRSRHCVKVILKRVKSLLQTIKSGTIADFSSVFNREEPSESGQDTIIW